MKRPFKGIFAMTEAERTFKIGSGAVFMFASTFMAMLFGSFGFFLFLGVGIVLCTWGTLARTTNRQVHFSHEDAHDLPL